MGRPLAIQYRDMSPFQHNDGAAVISRTIALVYPIPNYRIAQQEVDLLGLVTIDYHRLPACWSLNNAIVLFPVDSQGLNILNHFYPEAEADVPFSAPSDPLRIPAMVMPLLPEAFADAVGAEPEAVARHAGTQSLIRGISALQYALQGLLTPHQFQVYGSNTTAQENQARLAAGRPARLVENIVIRETLTARRSVSC